MRDECRPGLPPTRSFQKAKSSLQQQLCPCFCVEEDVLTKVPSTLIMPVPSLQRKLRSIGVVVLVQQIGTPRSRLADVVIGEVEKLEEAVMAVVLEML